MQSQERIANEELFKIISSAFIIGVNISEGRILRLLKSYDTPKMQPSNLRFKQRKLLYFLLIICLKKNLTRTPQIKFGQQISLISL
ncbi:hypothetical protein JL36_06460 [Lactococcus cremoris]|nr:hypothetical protein JL36_06460 [Lactococcus cremoris]